jgi:hypothetical protein
LNMGGISRRSAILAVPAAAAGAGAAAAGATARTVQTVEFKATRAKNTLPLSPPIGAPFIIYLTLRDPNGSSVGDGSFFGMVVDVIVDVPPKIVISAKAIFRLPLGEIHASSMQLWKVPEAGTKHPMAIVGGTGAYSTARGEGTIEHVTADLSAVTLQVAVD